MGGNWKCRSGERALAVWSLRLLEITWESLICCCHGIGRVREGEKMSRAYKAYNLLYVEVVANIAKTIGKLNCDWQS